MTAETEATDELPPRGFVFGQLLQTLVGALIGLILADFAAGAYDTDRDLRRPGAFDMHETLAWVNKPGFTDNDGLTRHNALGLRGPEVPDDASPTELRVVGVGASRTYGSGTPDDKDIWSASLQQLLASEGTENRVLNGGVNGYSALQASRRAIELTPVLQPDLILLFISPGAQMLLDPSAATQWVSVGGEVVPRDVAQALPEALAPAAVALHQALLGSNLYARYRAQLQASGDRPEHLRRFIFSEREPPAAAVGMLESAWRELAELVKYCREQKVALRAVLLPEAHQAREARWREWTVDSIQRGGPPLDMLRDEPTRALRNKLESLGLTVWTLDKEIEQIGADVDRFTVDGRHWTPLGHRVIAWGLLERLNNDGSLLQDMVTRRLENPRD